MPKSFDVSISFDITGDGSKFAKYTLDYSGLDYAQLQTLQHTLTEALLALGDAALPKPS